MMSILLNLFQIISKWRHSWFPNNNTYPIIFYKLEFTISSTLQALVLWRTIHRISRLPRERNQFIFKKMWHRHPSFHYTFNYLMPYWYRITGLILILEKANKCRWGKEFDCVIAWMVMNGALKLRSVTHLVDPLPSAPIGVNRDVKIFRTHFVTSHSIPVNQRNLFHNLRKDSWRAHNLFEEYSIILSVAFKLKINHVIISS